MNNLKRKADQTCIYLKMMSLDLKFKAVKSKSKCLCEGKS